MQGNPFFHSLNNFQADFERLENKENELMAHKNNLVKSLQQVSLGDSASLNQQSSLYQQSQTVKAVINESIDSWARTWSEASPIREFSDSFANKLIFLVFGKVNAGKSSFCNFLAEQFPEDQVTPFYLENGKVVHFEGKFSEGVVETTARIQGVELGSNLVLLDSPGLHSVTDENGDLTRKFTDSADAVLWLTPSTSPGQVQELEDLKIELENRKPLQPVLTRSDFFEEDIDENDELIQILFNKKPENRSLQEDDVHKRAFEKLHDGFPLKEPVSISVHTYKSADWSTEQSKQQALDEAGLAKLFIHLATLLDEARTYKVNKASRQVINFLDNQVLKQLNQVVIPQISVLQKFANETVSSLRNKKEYIKSLVVSDVCSAIPVIIEKHKNNLDKSAVAKDLNFVVEKALNDTLQLELKEFTDSIKSVSSSMSADSLGDFENITVDIKKVTGNRSKAMAAGLGTAAGAIFGSIVPGVGTAIGATFGGMLGGAAASVAGDYFVETRTETELVGISTDQITEKATAVVRKCLPELVSNSVQEVIQLVTSTSNYAASTAEIINTFEIRVSELKEEG
ncbi:MAG: GTPase [Bdellovibrionales bacterium]